MSVDYLSDLQRGVIPKDPLRDIVQIDHPLKDGDDIDRIAIRAGDVPWPQRVRLHEGIPVVIRQDENTLHVGHQVSEREDFHDLLSAQGEENRYRDIRMRLAKFLGKFSSGTKNLEFLFRRRDAEQLTKSTFQFMFRR